LPSEPARVVAVDKPAGMTSHDVVARVRHLLGGAKVGHAGTLDPDATGVLVLCIGKATKISSFLMAGQKEYRGIGRLGVRTDTQDASGAVLEERPVTASPDDVRLASERFVGRIEQIPPMYSAVKVEGQKLYRLARKGVEVERAPRPVFVESFEIGSVDLPDFEFHLKCSKGTYVRTVLHDLGEALGCGGHLVRLTRSRQGTFTLDEALPWAAVEGPDAADAIRDRWVEPESALAFLGRVTLPAGSRTPRVGEVVPGDFAEPPGTLLRFSHVDGAHGVVKVDEDGLRVLHRFGAPASFGRGKRVS
jgi:tRNA pseudouridine55 synthase